MFQNSVGIAGRFLIEQRTCICVIKMTVKRVENGVINKVQEDKGDLCIRAK